MTKECIENFNTNFSKGKFEIFAGGFKDREFERAVRDTLISSKVSMVDRREKALDGIIWRKILKR